jgi:oxygen-independent coproporphyrinogen-3 oxidase
VPSKPCPKGNSEPGKSLGLYLHIPFCRAKCAYCDFNSYAGMEGLQARYVQALCTEVSNRARELGSRSVDSIYIGGGTPTVLPASLLEEILSTCVRFFSLQSNAEISIEANPGTLDPQGLLTLRKAGVNRLSLGVQSLSDKELHMLGRIHDAAEALQAFRWARAGGMENINLDLIYGLPLQSLAAWKSTVEQAIELTPEHLSLYALSVEASTPLAAEITAGRLPAPDPDLAADMYAWSVARLEQAGYEHYELSNWALRQGRSDTRCRHNLKYWQVRPYLGLGAGAHSQLGHERSSNVSHPLEYAHRIESGLAPTAERTVQSAPERMAETMILGLRLMDGVSFSDFRRQHNRELNQEYARELEELSQQGLLAIDAVGVRLTAKAWLLANRVFVNFWPRAT